MILRFEMKGAKALREAIEKCAADECAGLDLSADEREAVVKARVKKTIDACVLWFANGGTATVEIDTDAVTCVVIPASPVMT